MMTRGSITNTEEHVASLKDQANNYAKYVRDVHTPTVSFKKRQELEKLKEKLKHPVRNAKFRSSQ